MAIADTINSMKTNITNAYNAIQTKGGTIPTNKNLENLSTAINSITTFKPEQEKTTDLSMLNGNQIISPDSGKVLSKVIITKPTTLTSENIRKDTNIGGVVGTLEEAKPEQEKPITITTNGSQTVMPDEGKVLSKVTITTNVTATPTEEKTVELALANGNQVLTPTAGKNFSKVTITKPATLTPENIKKDTNIGGVVGTLKEAKPEIEKRVWATNRRQTILPDNGETFSKVIIEAAPLPSVNNPIYKNINRCLIDKNKILILGCSDSYIPWDGSVISIGDYAFYSCTGLTNITIPRSVTSIGKEAFRYCVELTSVTIGSDVTSIDDFAFADCSRLTSVTIDSGVTSIGNYAFSRCSRLTSVTIPDSVTSIGYNAFWNCSGLTSVTMLPTNPPTLGSDVIPSNVTTITVPAGCGNTYKTAAGWSAYADKIVEAAADPGYGPNPTYPGLWYLFGDNNFRGAKNSVNVFDEYGFMSDFISNYSKISGGATSYWTQFIEDLSAAGDIVKSSDKDLTEKDFDNMKQMIKKAFSGVSLTFNIATSSASEFRKSGYMEMKVTFEKNFYKLYMWLKTEPYAPLD